MPEILPPVTGPRYPGVWGSFKSFMKDSMCGVDNHKDLFMHFPSMSRNGQVTTAGWYGQALF